MAIDDLAFSEGQGALTKREWATVMIVQGMLAGGAPVQHIDVLVNTAAEIVEAAITKAERD